MAKKGRTRALAGRIGESTRSPDCLRITETAASRRGQTPVSAVGLVAEEAPSTIPTRDREPPKPARCAYAGNPARSSSRERTSGSKNGPTAASGGYRATRQSAKPSRSAYPAGCSMAAERKDAHARRSAAISHMGAAASPVSATVSVCGCCRGARLKVPTTRTSKSTTHVFFV